MALVPYSLARTFLFALDAEVAHDLTIKSMACSQASALKWAYANERVDDPFELAGLRFPNRIGLAAGLDKNARCIDALEAMGFGFVEVGTVTPLPQAGNPRPRLFRLPNAQALINRFGFNNAGLQAFVGNIEKSAWYRRRQTGLAGPNPMQLGLNIGKNAATPIERAADDYLLCLDGVYPYADYITLNISSPNTKNLRHLQNDAALESLLQQVAQRRQLLAQKHGRLCPIFLKIAPDLDAGQILAMAQILKPYGCTSDQQASHSWGVIASNTTLSRAAVQGLAHADEVGGLSGAPLLAPSNAVLGQLRSALGKSFPIIGAGGVIEPTDALSKIKAGANLVQIYTGLIYRGPALVRDAAALLQKTRAGRTSA